MKKIIVICYTNLTHSTQHCVETTLSLDEWIKQHENYPYRIDYAFDKSQDLYKYKNDIEMQFVNNCHKYNMTKDTLQKRFTNKEGNIIRIIGMNLANKKYKFIILNEDKNKTFKVTERYITNSLQEII